MKDVIILDNSPISYRFQPENGLPISNWYDDLNDDELHSYTQLLEELSRVDDVRPYLEKVKTHEKFMHHKAEDLVRNLQRKRLRQIHDSEWKSYNTSKYRSVHDAKPYKTQHASV